MKKVITAIDVGTTKICTIIGNTDSGGNVQVLGVGVVPSHGLHKGMVVNVDEAKESIAESVRRAEQASGIKAEAAYVGVTGRHISSTNARGVVAIPRNDRLVRSDDPNRDHSSCPPRRPAECTANLVVLTILGRPPESDLASRSELTQVVLQTGPMST